MPQRPPRHQPRPARTPEPKRASASARGYGRHWQHVARAFLCAHPLCADPFGAHGKWQVPARHVDHVIPRSAGGADEWDNLQALCNRCHSRKTTLCDGGFGRRRRDFQEVTAMET